MNINSLNPKQQPIVVTGIGAVLPTGEGIDSLWHAWSQQQSALSPFNSHWLRSRQIPRYGHIAPELQQQAHNSVPHKLRRYSTDATELGVYAAGQAMQHAGLDWRQMPEERRGLFTAQGDYSAPSLESFHKGIQASKTLNGELDLRQMTEECLFRRGLEPFVAVKSLANNLLALVSLTYRFRGDGGAFVQNESAAIAALSAAIFSLRHGYCDWALVVGAGSYLCPLTLSEQFHLGHLSSLDQADALRSFDQHRSGTTLADGAIALVLETPEHAKARNAKALIQIEAIGTHATGRPGQVPSHAYQSALTRAQNGQTQLSTDLILADGRGSYHDQGELQALEHLTQGQITPISSPRPVVGMVAGCAPLMDLALNHCLYQHQRCPAIPFLQQPASAQLNLLQHDYQGPIDQILNLQQGFCGFYSALLTQRPTLF